MGADKTILKIFKETRLDIKETAYTIEQTINKAGVKGRVMEVNIEEDYCEFIIHVKWPNGTKMTDDKLPGFNKKNNL